MIGFKGIDSRRAKLFIVICLGLMTGCHAGAIDKTSVKVNQLDSIRGLDLSKYQGEVDFEKVKASGIRYIFIRATEGETYQDAYFLENLQRAKAIGLTVGAYHFYETNDSPELQLKNFTNLVKLRAGDLPPVIDIEKLHNNDHKDLSKNLTSFLQGLESHYKVKPIVYSGLNFANLYVTTFGDYPLWLAEYGVSSPTIPKGWKEWTFWQWSQKGRVSGIKGDVDKDRFNGNDAKFRDLLIK